MIHELTEAQCRAAMSSGEFGKDVAGASPRVAVVLTQSWCPQWRWMRGYLDPIAAAEGTEIFWVEYDLQPWFDAFREFKEERFRNHEVPYVRYYRDGKLVKESNYIDKAGFGRLLGS